MAKADAHKWEFKVRFRRRTFGWKSQPAITRVKQAVVEIKKVAKMLDAYRSTLAAAERHGSVADVQQPIRHLVASEGTRERFVTKMLGKEFRLWSS